jgi:hypothetical protein
VGRRQARIEHAIASARRRNHLVAVRSEQQGRKDGRAGGSERQSGPRVGGAMGKYHATYRRTRGRADLRCESG